jgi:hypothetical protein
LEKTLTSKNNSEYTSTQVDVVLMIAAIDSEDSSEISSPSITALAAGTEYIKYADSTVPVDGSSSSLYILIKAF